MQNRMRTHPLSEEQISRLLRLAQTGSLATLNPDGTPYCTPIHFVWFEGAIFFHGLQEGKKLDNIARDPRVGFTVYELHELLLDPSGKPCGTNTKYESVILSGRAEPVEGIEEKRNVLREIVKKYTPQLASTDILGDMMESTAVVRIDILELTGKYYS